MGTTMSPGDVDVSKHDDSNAVAVLQTNGETKQENAASHFRPIRARGGASASEIIIRDRGE
jgi:hypothetical protein